MKMVKSLLLGSAAGLLAVAGAQAADMPVKAAPVEYVKVCSLYGAGFYYVPGTDICVKIGGYVRAQYYAAHGSNPPFQNGTIPNTRNGQNAANNEFLFRARALVTMDTRAQTDWGTVRTYFNLGLQYTGASKDTNDPVNGASASPYYTRAFIQWAGFTFGLAQSFFDAFPQGSYMYWAAAFGDTSDAGQLLAAYTTQWGNGLSSTISVEAPRRQGVWNADSSFGLATSNNDSGNIGIPDIVTNFRIDQAWGSFQVMSALHQARAAYYFWEPGAACNTPGTTIVNSMECGYPTDKFGWAVGAAGNINLPFLGQGDTLGFQVAYAEGATRYVNNLGNGSPVWFGGNYSLGWGTATDAIVRDNIPGVQNGDVELTQSWGFIAAYQHLWTPFLKTSVYGGGYEISYNGTASNWICGTVNIDTNLYGCDPDYGLWFVGTRTQWNIRPDFYMGVDVIYQKLDTAFGGALADVASTGARPSSPPPYKIEDQDALAVTFRVHRDILP